MAWQKCPICDGTGKVLIYKTSTENKLCSVCNGTKLISMLTGKPPVTDNNPKIKENNES